MQRGNGMSHERSPGPRHDGSPARRPRCLRFGEFEFDPETLELRGDGRVVRLQPQPARLLELLIARRGAVVSREDVRRHLWPDKVHVEFNQSMNSCVKRIRVVLGDSADAPEYIETLPRLGYRFLQPVSEVDGVDDAMFATGGTGPRWRSTMGAVLTTVGVVIGIAATALIRHALDPATATPTEPSRKVLTVLPFSAVETWAGAEPFRQGLTQELITSLGRQRPNRLAVVARDTRPVPSAGGGVTGLRTDFLLDGRVQREEGRLRVWARLVQAADGTLLWSESYDGAAGDTLVFQADVGGRIAAAVIDRLAQRLVAAPRPRAAWQRDGSLQLAQKARARDLLGAETQQVVRDLLTVHERVAPTFEAADEMHQSYLGRI